MRGIHHPGCACMRGGRPRLSASPWGVGGIGLDPIVAKRVAGRRTRVGTRETGRPVLRGFAVFAATILVLLAFQTLASPVAAPSTGGGGRPRPPGGSLEAQGGSAGAGGRWNETWDPTEPDPGNVTGPYVTPPASSLLYADSKVRPVLVERNDSWTYATAHGNYTFSASSPHRFNATNLEGEREIRDAAFFVTADVPLDVISSSIVSKNSTLLRVNYTVGSGGVAQGNVTMTVSWYETRAPDFEATFAIFGNSTITTYRLEWRRLGIWGSPFGAWYSNPVAKENRWR